nr:hypothetical protein [Nannocystis pusilla]
MGDDEAVDATGDRPAEPGGDEVEPADAHRALPRTGEVVRFGQIEGRVLGDEGTGAVARAVGAQHPEPAQRRRRRDLGAQRLGLGEGDRRRGDEGEEAAVGVQQRAVGALEDHGRGVALQGCAQLLALVRVQARGDREVGVGDDVGEVRARELGDERGDRGRRRGLGELLGAVELEQLDLPERADQARAVAGERADAEARRVRVVSVAPRRADAEAAAAVTTCPSGQLLDAAEQAVERGDDGAAAIDDEVGPRIDEAGRLQGLGLAGQRQRLDEHEAAEAAAGPGERAGAELGEAVDAPRGGDDVVGRLRAAVEAGHQRPAPAGPHAGERVDDGALALVAEAEAEDGDRSFGTGSKCQVTAHGRVAAGWHEAAATVKPRAAAREPAAAAAAVIVKRSSAQRCDGVEWLG